MKKKDITINDLAIMVQKGFNGVDKRFDAVDKRLEKIENLVLANHQRRIEKLESEVKNLRELFAM